MDEYIDGPAHELAHGLAHELAHDLTTQPLRPIDIRRAVLATFFRANGGPLAIDDVVRLTREESGLDLATLPGVSPHRRVSDILRHQVRTGKAEVESRGRYRLLVRRFSRSSEWRALRWQDARAERIRRRYLGMS